MPQKSYYGGQAIIEGVMIRGRKNIAIAVRCPDDHIDLHTEPIQGIFAGWMKKIPLLRGVLTLLEMMVIGTRALMRSARLALGEDEEEEGGDSYSWLMWGTMVLGLVVGVGIFFVGPLFIQEWLDSYIDSSVLLNLIEGVIRLFMFLGYLLLIGTMKDIKRVFAYHGAEHMSIHALLAQHGHRWTRNDTAAHDFPMSGTRRIAKIDAGIIGIEKIVVLLRDARRIIS